MKGNPPSNSPAQDCSEESREWRQFWKIAFFATILPFLVLLGALEWLGWSLGETYTPAALIRALDEHPDMSWAVTNGHVSAELKLAQVARERPEVLIMGHSRLARIRASMFAPYTFYNMSRVSWPFKSYADLLRRLPEDYVPKLILFNVDFFMFSPGYSKKWIEAEPVFGHSIRENLIEVCHVFTQVAQHPKLLWQRRNPSGFPASGCSAILGGDSFFKDGSSRDADKSVAIAGRSRDSLLNREVMEEYLSGGTKMSAAEMEDLKQFIDLARQKGIPMVAVQMPIYGPALRLLEKDPSYGIVNDFYDHEAQGYFERLGILFFDYLKMPPYSEDYRYFIDPVHPGWPLSVAVVEAMGSDARFHTLLPRMDLEALRRQLRADREANQHVFLDNLNRP